MLRWVTVVGVLGGAGAAAAEPVRMTGDDIKRAMQPGAVLEIDTPVKVSIPVKVAPNGMVSGEAGALGLTLGALKDRGRWWTEGDQLCMKWFRWFDAKARCVSLQREGNRVLWYENSGESGTATLTEVPSTTVAAARPPEKKPRVETAALDTSTPQPERHVAEPRPRAVITAPVAQAAKPTSDPVHEQAAAPSAPSAPAMKPASAPAIVAAKPSPVPPRRPHQAKAPAQPAAAAAMRKPLRGHGGEPNGASTSSMALVSFRVSGVVDGDTLNVRTGPSEYHQAVGAIPARGRGVQIVGACQDLWCPIRHGRLKGWVNRYYLAEDVGQQTADKR